MRQIHERKFSHKQSLCGKRLSSSPQGWKEAHIAETQREGEGSACEVGGYQNLHGLVDHVEI